MNVVTCAGTIYVFLNNQASYEAHIQLFTNRQTDSYLPLQSLYRPLQNDTMQFFHAIALLSTALGAMAGCQADENLCKSDVLSIEKGHTSGWECDLAEDLPCQTTCDVTGKRQSDNGFMKSIKCCAPCTCLSTLLASSVLAGRCAVFSERLADLGF